MNVDIRFISSEDWEEAMALVYRVYLEFDAKMYSEEGNRHFKEFISDSFLKRMFEAGDYQVVGAYYGNRMVGVISLRENHHVSLLFVDKAYHNKGIGRSMILAMADYAKLKLHQEYLTVHASLYATDFYHKVGFTDEGPITVQDGITYTPMKYLL